LAVSTTTKFGQPALIGGLFLGILSALPFIYLGNCCCLWILGGGAVAAYVLQQNQPDPITPGDGAMAGLLAGLLGAVVQFVLSIPIDLVAGPWERAFGQRMLEFANNPQLQETLQRSLDDAARGGFAVLVARRFLVMLVMLAIAGVFATVGGVLGSVMFKKPPVPAPPSP